MIDWKPNRDSGVEAELVADRFRAHLWAWPDVSMFVARVLVEREGHEPADPFDQIGSAESQEEAQQKAADLLQLYLDGDPEEQAFKEKLRAWVSP